MRIAMMADVYKPHVSGVTNYISLNKQYLELAGHEVTIFTFGNPGAADAEERVVRSRGIPLGDTGYSMGFRLSHQAKLLLQSMDVVHVHHPFVSGQLALRYTRPLRIPVVFTNHTRYDLYAHAYLPFVPVELSASFLKRYMPSFCAAVDLVISPSEGMAGILRRLGVKSPIEVIPNGIELERYSITCADCRAEQGFTPEDLLLVYSGRLAPEKDLEFLLQVFDRVAARIERVRLLIIGGGPQEARLRQLASQSSLAGRIHFTGMVPYAEMPRLLAMGDIFMTASRTEVHPLSVIEAMASGLPAVGIHSVGVGDTIQDGLTGFLTRHDPAAFAAQVVLLCQDEGLRARMGAAARQAASRYAIQSTSAAVLAQYERLHKQTRGHRRGLGHSLRTLLEKLRP